MSKRGFRSDTNQQPPVKKNFLQVHERNIMYRFFIKQPKLAGQKSVITGSDAKHIKNVLRLKPGDKIELFDGKGFVYKAEITSLSPGDVEVSIICSFSSATESPVQIIVAQALLKNRKMDGLVRQLTELGITKWIPFIAKRSVPRPDKKQLAARAKRWEKIAQEAPKQCKRSQIMEIGSMASFEDVLSLGKEYNPKIVFWENESKPVNSTLSLQHDGHFNKILVVLGPEGGFTSEEIKRAIAGGFVTASLGPRILRAETATIVACALLQYIFGDLGTKNS